MMRLHRRRLAGLAGLLAVGIFASAADAQKLEITGRVLAQDGQPLADTELVLLPAAALAQRPAHPSAEKNTPAATARSAQDGSFRLLAPEAGFWWLVARHPGYLDTAARLAAIFHDKAIGTIQLPPRREVTVRVVAADGTLLTNVRVIAGCEPSEQRSDDGEVRWLWPQSVMADAEGRARLGTKPGRELIVGALEAGAFGLTRLGEQPSETTLTLDRRATEVQLRDTANRPLAGVAALLAAPMLVLATSDQQGILRLPELRPEEQLVLLRGVIFEAPLGGSPAIAPQTTSDGARTLHLAAAERFDLEIVDWFSREPIAGALVWGYGGYERADRRGSLRLELPPDELAHLEVGAPGYVAVRIGAHQKPARDGEPIRVALVPELTLSGRVITTDGQPLAGAEVAFDSTLAPFPDGRELVPTNHWLRPRPSTTDADGRFRARDLAPGVALEIQVRRAGFAARRWVLPPFAPGVVPPPMEIALERAVTAVGQVLGEHEQPIAGVEVTLLAETDGGSNGLDETRGLEHRATTDTSGRFVFDELTAGSFTLTAWAAGHAELKLPGLEIAATEGAGDTPTDLGTLVLDRGLVLEGVVVDPEGRPVAGAKVHVSRLERRWGGFSSSSDPRLQNISTNAEGRFRIEALSRAVALDLSVVHDGFLCGGLSNVKPALENQVRIQLQARATLDVLVVDTFGEPVAGAEVRLRRITRDGFYESDHSTNTKGRAWLFCLDPGEVALSAGSAEGMAPPRPMMLTSSREPVEVRLELQPSERPREAVRHEQGAPAGAVKPPAKPKSGRGRLEGKLLGFALAELAEARVWAIADGVELEARVRHDGSYLFDRIPAGSWKLIATIPRTTYTRPEPVVVTGDEGTARVDLPLGLGRPLPGRVWLDGKPAALHLELACAEAGIATTTDSRHDGRFGFDNVPPASCELVASDYGLGLQVRLAIGTEELGAGSGPWVATDPTTGVELRVELERLD